jgi:hypothetical protein
VANFLRRAWLRDAVARAAAGDAASDARRPAPAPAQVLAVLVARGAAGCVVRLSDRSHHAVAVLAAPVMASLAVRMAVRVAHAMRHCGESARARRKLTAASRRTPTCVWPILRRWSAP